MVFPGALTTTFELTRRRPCYENLSNNVPTELMKLKVNSWKPDTPSIVNHSVLKEYIHDTAFKLGVSSSTLYDTRGELIMNVGNRWLVESSTILRLGL